MHHDVFRAARGEQHANRRTSSADLLRQLMAVHAAWHDEARVIHEVEAVRLAVRRRTAADTAAMRAAIAAARRSLAARVNLADDDEAFHLALVAAADQVALSDDAVGARYAYFAEPRNAALSITEHERILASVEQGSGSWRRRPAPGGKPRATARVPSG